MTHVGQHRAGPGTRPGPNRRGWPDRFLSVLLVGAVLAAVTVAAGGLTGYRLVTVNSGSMTPTLRVGDLVVDRSEAPARLHPGDIVTFQHPALHVLVTHRVVAMHTADGWVEVTTKGDANRVTESWRVRVTGRVGLVLLRIPMVGRLSAGLAATALVGIAGLLAVAWLLRRIWGTPARAPRGTRKARVRGSGHV